MSINMDLSFLKDIPPYTNDFKELTKGINIEQEIEALSREINSINTNSSPFNKYDYVVVFLSGLLGGISDLLVGKPAAGYVKDAPKGSLLGKACEPKIDDNFAGGLGKYLKKYDVKNNPIDAHIPGIQVGDHRLYSYGHDLLRVFETLSLIMTGTGKVGISGNGGEVYLEQAQNGYKGVDSIWEAIIVLALHLYKDYCSVRSLPIPGSTIIANLNNNTMPEFIDKLTNDMEYNLRTLNGQATSIAVIEIIISIYNGILNACCEQKQKYTESQIKHKKEKMLLLAHTIAMLINTGKVCITKNPAFINFPQIIRIVKLAFNCVKEEMNITHKSLENANLGVYKNKYEVMQTLIILDEAVYYTSHMERIINENLKAIEDFDKEMSSKHEKNMSIMNSKLSRLRDINF